MLKVSYRFEHICIALAFHGMNLVEGKGTIDDITVHSTLVVEV